MSRSGTNMSAVYPAKTNAAAMTDLFWESAVMRLRSLVPVSNCTDVRSI
jgi:hypothetical protein